jgi:hypothetical protein
MHWMEVRSEDAPLAFQHNYGHNNSAKLGNYVRQQDGTV